MSYSQDTLIEYANRECANGISSISASIYNALEYMGRNPDNLDECLWMINAVGVISSEIDKLSEGPLAAIELYGDILGLYNALNVRIANLMLYGVTANGKQAA